MKQKRLCQGVLVVALSGLVACNSASEQDYIASAKALLAKQDLNGALIQLKNAVGENPKSAEARLLLGKTLMQGGDPNTGLVELQKAQGAGSPYDEVVPELARALLATGESNRLLTQFSAVQLSDPAAVADLKTSLATALSLQGQAVEARGTAQGALQALPGYAPAHVLLARLDAATGDTSQALKHLDGVLSRDPSNAEAGLLKGEILARSGSDPQAALVALRQVRDTNPQSVAAHAAVINTLLQQDLRAEARAEFPALLKLAPNHPDTVFVQAQFAYDDENYLLCRELTQKLLARTPNNVLLLSLAGAAEYQLKSFTVAEDLLSRALKVSPQMLATRQLLAKIHLRNAQPSRALALLEPVIAAADADGISLGLAGEALLQTGDNKRADETFQRALKAAPDNVQVGTVAAMSRHFQGDITAAARQLEALARSERSEQPDLALVSTRLRQNDVKGALQAVDALITKQPDRALPLVLRGRILATQLDFAGATASFEQALTKEPRNFAAIDGLAALELRAGKGEQARARFESLVNSDPRDMRARLALADIDTRLGAPEPVVLAHLRAAVKADPRQPQPHLALTERLLLSKDYKSALAAARDASAALPDNVNVMELLGRAQMTSGDVLQAIGTLKQLTSLQPQVTKYKLQLADAYWANRDASAAAAALRQAAAQDPDDLMAQRGLAMMALQDDRKPDAIAIARAIQKRLPKGMEGFALEGELEESSRNWSAASQAYAAALKRGSSGDVALRLHRCLVAAGKPADANRMAAEWTAANPKDWAFARYLGERALSAKDWPAAEAQFRTVLEIQPLDAAAMNNIAWLLATQKKPGGAAMAQRALQMLPDHPALLDTLALAQEIEGQAAQALETQRRAVQVAPKDPTLRLHLARMLAAQGNKTEARAELESLSRLGSDFAAQDEVAALLKTL